MSEKSMNFDRVKAIVKENIQLVVYPAYRTGRLTLLAMKMFLDGSTQSSCTTRKIGDMLCKRIAEYVDASDIRCVREIVSLVPKGADNRLPAWLYGPIEARLEDKGWTVYEYGGNPRGEV